MTRTARWFVDAADEILAGMGAATNEPLNRFLEEQGGLEDLDIYFVQVAHGFAPEPVSPEHFARRTPYANPEALEQKLAESAERGWIEPVAAGQYGLTSKGDKTAQGIFSLADRIYGPYEPLPQEDLERIAALLREVVNEARTLPEPEDKWALSWGIMFDRGPAAPAMIKVRRSLLDLLAFRDDAHIAAWRAYEDSGLIWEAFTYVWRGEVGNATQLAEKLSAYRDYDEKTYDSALRSLIETGWIVESEGGYKATEDGTKLRLEAEDATDAYFDPAWTCLDDSEFKELKALLERLADAVKPSGEDAA